jgi:hypothetical protein
MDSAISASTHARLLSRDCIAEGTLETAPTVRHPDFQVLLIRIICNESIENATPVKLIHSCDRCRIF